MTDPITFEDIVELWATMSPLVMINAYRVSIRKRPNSVTPDGVKDLLCGKSEYDSGLIARQWGILQQMIAAIELAYRRGEQREDIGLRHNRRPPIIPTWLRPTCRTPYVKRRCTRAGSAIIHMIQGAQSPASRIFAWFTHALVNLSSGS